MEEPAFEGIPLDASPAAAASAVPQQAAPERRMPQERTPTQHTGSGAPRAVRGAVGATGAARAPALRIAAGLQRAHAAVLEAHQAVAAWQRAHPPLTGAGTPPQVVRPRADTAGGRTGPRRDGVPGTLRALAAAWAAAGIAPWPGRAVLTWHDDVPDGEPAVHAVREGDGRWRLRAGDRVLATATTGGTAAPAAGCDGAAEWRRRPVPRFPADPRPLARTAVDRLTGAQLDALARGDAAAVFGPGHDQSGLLAEELPAPWPVRLLRQVTAIEPRGGRFGQGRLRALLPAAAPDPAGDGEDGAEAWSRLVAAAMEVLQVHAVRSGLHLCVPGARVRPLPECPTSIEVDDASALRSAVHAASRADGPAREGPVELALDVEVSAARLMDRPHLVADCRVEADGATVARLRDVGVELRERPGADPSPGRGRATCRLAAGGSRVLLDERHTARIAGRDAGQVLGCAGARDGDLARPRLPSGDLRMVDRFVRGEDGGRRSYALGSRGSFEYDVPEDPWYVRENNGVWPQLAWLEAALQPSGLFAAWLGCAGEFPGRDLYVRNLDGNARLLREVELPGTTVEQQVTLRSHAPLPGGLIQRYGIEVHAGGLPCWTAEATHGVFTGELMAQQQGLDGGRRVPTWLEEQAPDRHAVRRIDVRGDDRTGRGRLALLEDVAVVPGGGLFGAGYALCTKQVRPDDWFFGHHFPGDPVMPGSAGVQMLYQAVHAYALHAGLADPLDRPRCTVAVGEELRWSYRGQILRDHGEVRGEVHLREVRKSAGTVRVHADGSVWRDGLRIYRVENIAVDLRTTAPAAEGSRR